MSAFAKYQGAGNDFIIISHFPNNPAQTAIALCDRHYGVGADGLLIATPSLVADMKMTYLNSDGSSATMCGNGLRCFVQYLYDEHLVNKLEMNIETDAGILHGIIHRETNSVTVSLGQPRPLNLDECLSEETNLVLDIGNRQITVSTIFTSTVHCVVMIQENMDIEQLGPMIESHPIFPQRINVNFVKVTSEHSMDVTTYERGAGWTKACGSGVMASAILAKQFYPLNNTIRVTTSGGQLEVNTSAFTLRSNATRIAKGEAFL